MNVAEEIAGKLSSGDDKSIQSALEDLSFVQISDMDSIAEELLKSSLVKLFNRSVDVDQKGAIIWHLGRFFDDELKGFFIKSLKYFVNQKSEMVWQSMVALDNLGIPLIEGCSGIRDRDKNLAAAKEFLEGDNGTRSVLKS